MTRTAQTHRAACRLNACRLDAHRRDACRLNAHSLDACRLDACRLNAHRLNACRLDTRRPDAHMHPKAFRPQRLYACRSAAPPSSRVLATAHNVPASLLSATESEA